MRNCLAVIVEVPRSVVEQADKYEDVQRYLGYALADARMNNETRLKAFWTEVKWEQENVERTSGNSSAVRDDLHSKS